MVNSLREHAVHIIRPEIRDSNLAYAFIRGRSFASVEQTRYSDPNWENVLAIATRFWNARYGNLNSEGIAERFAMWKQAAPLRSVYVPREKSDQPRRHKPLSDYKAEKKMDLWVA